MKTKLGIVWAVSFVALSLCLQAGDEAKSKPCLPEFERLKSLIGTWKGQADMGNGPIDMTIKYRLIAGGSVLEERIFPGTPNEMVTMYYEKEGKVALTHYCVMGNRPIMILASSDEKTLEFDFDPSCGINPVKESHMHGMTIRFQNPDTIVTSCKAVINGEPAKEHKTTLKRVKDSADSSNT